MNGYFINTIIITGIISTFIMPYLLILCYKDICYKNNLDFNFRKKPIKYTTMSIIVWWLLYSIITITIVVSNSPNKPNKQQQNYYKKREKDSIDYIIEKRANTPFNNTIFANIKFGESSQIVEQKLKIYKQRFGNIIYADSSRYKIYNINLYYYKDKLQTLVINFDGLLEDSKDLWKLYESKYGKTRFCDWEFQDVIIDYSERTNAKQVWDNKGYNDKQYYFYNNNYKTITSTPSYHSVITYTSKTIASEEEADKEMERLNEKRHKLMLDSIRKVKELK